jgi:hypothetical protein
LRKQKKNVAYPGQKQTNGKETPVKGIAEVHTQPAAAWFGAEGLLFFAQRTPWLIDKPSKLD